ncbi:ABC transporter permease subunit [Thermogladius sp. KZ2Tp1]|uniref:ABC transporter permease n=1 Tax=Thermogladius sp. KZ2Tp1 TaxID=3136289 RepID=UPI003DA9A796
MNPVLYDFKRGLLRLSVIVALSLFILAGVGLAYLTSSTLATTPGTTYVALYSYVSPARNQFYLEALLLTPDLKSTEGGIFYELDNFTFSKPNTPPETTVLDSGVVTGYGKISVLKNLTSPIGQFDKQSSLYLKVDVTTKTGSYSFTTSYSRPFTLDNDTVYVASSIPFSPPADWAFYCLNETSFPIKELIPQTRPPGVIVLTPLQGRTLSDKYLDTAFLLVSHGQGRYELVSVVLLLDRDNLTYELYLVPNSTSLPDKVDYGNLASYLIPLGEVAPGLNLVRFNVGNSSELEKIVWDFQSVTTTTGEDIVGSLHVLLVARNSSCVIVGYANSMVSTVSSVPMGKIVAGVLAGTVGLAPFSMFFPILMIYLAYVYLAKPRSSGSLEFLLARPITRLDVYITRFVAGVLVALASSLLFFASTMLTLQALIGVYFDLYSYLLLFAGLAASLIAFYSVCYAIASSTRGGAYIALAVAAYLLFTILYQIIVIVVTQLQGIGPDLYERLRVNMYISYYLSPLGPTSFSQYYFGIHNGLSIEPKNVGSVVNPLLVVASAVLWVIVPFVIGWLKFRRANLIG